MFVDINDVCIVSKYEPRMQNLDKLSLTPKTTCPNFQPILNLIEQFGSMSPISIETGEQAKTAPCLQHRPRPLSPISPIDKCWMSHLTLQTYLLNFLNYLLFAMSCFDDESICIMKIYNLEGTSLKTIQILSKISSLKITHSHNVGIY